MRIHRRELLRFVAYGLPGWLTLFLLPKRHEPSETPVYVVPGEVSLGEPSASLSVLRASPRTGPPRVKATLTSVDPDYTNSG